MIKTFVAGRIGADPELRQAGATQVLRFRVAADFFNYQTKTRDTQWVSGSIFGKRAEQLAPLLKKGAAVAFVGSQTIRTYEDKSGKTRVDVEITTDDVALQGGGAPREGGGPGRTGPGDGPTYDPEIPF